MAIIAEAQTLSTTSSVVVTSTNHEERVLVKNSDATITVYVGGTSAVDSTDGFPVAAGESITLTLGSGEELHAVAASGTPSINVIRSGD
jgi:oxalate decarboxylase/phosphoglucose isomerase-like protein (cupin superfamily)